MKNRRVTMAYNEVVTSFVARPLFSFPRLLLQFFRCWVSAVDLMELRGNL